MGYFTRHLIASSFFLLRMEELETYNYYVSETVEVKRGCEANFGCRTASSAAAAESLTAKAESAEAAEASAVTARAEALVAGAEAWVEETEAKSLVATGPIVIAPVAAKPLPRRMEDSRGVPP
ncbi:hypothetical protein AAHE18_09G220800 [Arachis hypogaea]